ncbi:PREDICTED: uncharacterized protein LOC108551432 [Eufriesea mexicana]|uniref:uncharacterized protein LOC108551432 n=1 Tax=Eufriesea mexicana TaxID=516756 RepID=UPI00083C40F5|nr:PREDICTED: uncharacterized protein LOC108551432 [Eufriesea mexicana]
MKIFYTLENVQWFNPSYNLRVNFLYPQQNLNSTIFVRAKSQGKIFSKGEKKEEEEEDENEIDEIDDYLRTQNSKIIVTKIPSLRLDVIAKIGFGMSRSKLDKEFYKNNIRLNGERCLKKGVMIHIKDQIDYIKGKSPTNPNYLIVDRCVLVSVNTTEEMDTIYVKIIQNKSLLVDDYNIH